MASARLRIDISSPDLASLPAASQTFPLEVCGIIERRMDLEVERDQWCGPRLDSASCTYDFASEDSLDGAWRAIRSMDGLSVPAGTRLSVRRTGSPEEVIIGSHLSAVRGGVVVATGSITFGGRDWPSITVDAGGRRYIVLASRDSNCNWPGEMIVEVMRQ